MALHRQPIPSLALMETEIGPFAALLMVFASGAIALHFAQDRDTVNVFFRTSTMMHRLYKMQYGQAPKEQSGAYKGKGRLLRDDVERLELYVRYIPQNVLSDKICHRAAIRCDILFQKLKAVDWVIPVDGELMKELEGCEFEVTSASVVMVSAGYLVCSFLLS